MKRPKMNNLKMDKKGTKTMRNKVVKSKKVKITINFDSDVLDEIKKQADDMGSAYQTLLNKLVRDSLSLKRADEDRLSRLEKEVAALKSKVA